MPKLQFIVTVDSPIDMDANDVAVYIGDSVKSYGKGSCPYELEWDIADSEFTVIRYSQDKESMFLLFSGEDYYPRGGIADYKGEYKTIEEAKEEFYKIYKTDRCNNGDWVHIADKDTMKVLLHAHPCTDRFCTIEWHTDFYEYYGIKEIDSNG